MSWVEHQALYPGKCSNSDTVYKIESQHQIDSIYRPLASSAAIVFCFGSGLSLSSGAALTAPGGAQNSIYLFTIINRGNRSRMTMQTTLTIADIRLLSPGSGKRNVIDRGYRGRSRQRP